MKHSTFGESHKSTWLFCFVAAFCAIVLSLLNKFHPATLSPFYTAWVISFAIALLLGDNGKHTVRLFIASLGISVLIAMMANYSTQQYGAIEGEYLLVIALYAMICLLQIYHQANSFKVSYEHYFRSVWNNFSVIVIALVFSGLVWLILSVWAGLFSFVHIQFFSRVFYNSYFIIVANSLLIVTGASIAYQSEKMIHMIRHFFLLLCKVIFPLVLLVQILCLIPIAVSLKHQFDIDTYSLLINSVEGLCLIGLILFNGVYQAGVQVSKLPQWYRGMLQCYPFFALLNALYLLIGVFGFGGFQIGSLMFLLTIVFFILYALGYMGLRYVPMTNKVLAYLIVLSMIAVNNPGVFPHLKNALSQPHHEASSLLENNQDSESYSLENTGISWVSSADIKNNTHPVIAVASNPPIGICRAACDNEQLIGNYQHGKCNIACHEKIIQPQQFVVLSGTNPMLSWDAEWSTNKTFLFSIRVISTEDNKHICRGIALNQILLGIQNSHSNDYCITFDPKTGKTIHMTFYQLLSLFK